MKKVLKSCVGLLVTFVVFTIIYIALKPPIWLALPAGYVGMVLIDWIWK